MRDNAVTTDEYGITSFTIVQDTGEMYLFQQEEGSDLLFITIMDVDGRATGKRVINITLRSNKEIADELKDYIREQQSEQKDLGNDR